MVEPDLWIARTPADQERARRAAVRGEFVRVLPRCYARRGCERDPGVLARALAFHDTTAVIAGAAAARLLWWPELSCDRVVGVRACRAAPSPWFRWQKRVVPEDLVMMRSGVRFTAPALTVLDLVPDLGPRAIDEALRRGACTLPQLWEALSLTPGRPHNTQRRRDLHDSRDAPWSPAERTLHRIHRACALPFAYETNHGVTRPDGRRAVIDLAVPDLMLGIEVDGYAFHGGREAFERDRDRDTQLACLGWQVVRFSAAFVEHRPHEVAARVTQIARLRAAVLGRPWG